MEYLLGVDVGSTMCKAALYDLEGGEIAVAKRKVDVRSPHPGWREVDPETLWQSASGAISEVLTHSGVHSSDVRGVGVSGAGNGVYMLSKDGEPVYPGMQSSDRRAVDIVAEWAERDVSAKSFPICFQMKMPGEMGACIAWVKKHEPEAYKRFAHALMVKDYVNYRLTGNYSGDISDMSGTSVVNLKTGRYSKELLELYGIPEVWDTLPTIHQSYEVVGTITRASARVTGLQTGTPVAAGLHDMSACALGSGAIRQGDLVSLVGTLALNELVASELCPRLPWSISYAVPGLFLTCAGGGASALNLEWFVSNFGGQERAEAAAKGISVYEVCNEKVASLAPGASSVIYHPYLLGDGKQSQAMAGFYGLKNEHTAAHVLRALYEGVVFGHFEGVEQFEALGLHVERLFLAGGGSRSAVWSQIFADTFNLPLSVADGSEVGAHGAAMCAGIGTGAYRDYAQAAEIAVRIARRHQPDVAATAIYRARYAEYKHIAEVMKEPWERLSKLGA